MTLMLQIYTLKFNPFSFFLSLKAYLSLDKGVFKLFSFSQAYCKSLVIVIWHLQKGESVFVMKKDKHLSEILCSLFTVEK